MLSLLSSVSGWHERQQQMGSSMKQLLGTCCPNDGSSLCYSKETAYISPLKQLLPSPLMLGCCLLWCFYASGGKLPTDFTKWTSHSKAGRGEKWMHSLNGNFFDIIQIILAQNCPPKNNFHVRNEDVHNVEKSWKKSHSSLKITQNVTFEFSVLTFTTNFCLKIDLSGNTVWPKTSCFQKLAKSTTFD